MTSTPVSSHTDLMTPPQKAEKVRALERALEVMRAMPTATPCSKCDLLSKDETGLCTFWRSVVPPDHRASGCENWVELVPF